MVGSRPRRALVAGNNTAILFEALFNNAQHSVATSRQSANHSIVLEYAGNVFACNQDTEPARSVHTVHTEDEEEEDDESNVAKSIKPSCQSKSQRQTPPLDPLVSFPCLKNGPTRQYTTQKAALQQPSPKKLKRSRTPSSSHQSKTNAILAPFASISRKLSHRRCSYDSDVKPRSEKNRRARQKSMPTRLLHATSFRAQQSPSRNTYVHPHIPIHGPYQTQFPTFLYIPINQTHHVISTAPPAAPAAYQHMPQCAPASTQEFPPGLQSLQNEINRVTSSLSSNPMESHLGHELSRLVTERNSLLDSATKQTRWVTPNLERKKTSTKAESENLRPEKENKVVEQNKTGVSVSGQSRVSGGSTDRLQVDAPANQLHFCTGCGQARSASFHKKHQYTKSVHNVCKKCREGKRAIGVLDRYYFCNSCGIVRSKEFHRRHAISANIPLRSKTCKNCYMHSKWARRSEEKSKLFKMAHPTPSQYRQSSPKPFMASSANTSRNNVRIETLCSEAVGPRPRSNSSPRRTQGLLSNYDGIADIGRTRRIEAEVELAPSSTFSANRPVLNAYVSPDYCDEDISPHDPASLNRSPHLSRSVSPGSIIQNKFDQKSTILTSHPPNPDSGSSHSPRLYRDSLQPNPYSPRSRATETSILFSLSNSTTPTYPHSPILSHPASSQSVQQDSTPDSPVLEEGKSSLEDGTKSRPGDLHVPTPGAVAGCTGIGRKDFVSDGAKAPEDGPTMPLEGQYGNSFGEKQRYTKGAFGKLASSFHSSAPKSPWESFSGPICNPSSNRGSRGAFFEARETGNCGGSHGGSGFEPSEAKGSNFGSYNASEESGSPTEPAEFSFRSGQPKSYSRHQPEPGSYADQGSIRGGSIRGAWNINTSFCDTNARSTASTFARSTQGHVPEPIIEEPSSPISKSPISTPLLLEFSPVDNLSDSGVEFLTNSSSSHASSLRTDYSLDSNMDALTLSHVQLRKL